MDWLTFVVSFFATIIVYGMIPTIVYLSRKNTINKRTWLWFIIGSAVIGKVFFLSITLAVGETDDLYNYAPTVLWSTVFYSLYKKGFKKKGLWEGYNVPETTKTENVKESPEDGIVPSVRTFTEDFETQKVAEQTVEAPADKGNQITFSEEYVIKKTTSVKKKKRCCSYCGAPIDERTRKCTGCGKQYFKGIKGYLSIIIIATVSLLLCASVVFNFLQYGNYQKLNDKLTYVSQERMTTIDNNNSLKREVSDLEQQVSKLEDKVESLADYRNISTFYEGNIALIIDDGTTVYHTYSCYSFQKAKSQFKNFWAYNTEAAKEKGYKPCSLCH